MALFQHRFSEHILTRDGFQVSKRWDEPGAIYSLGKRPLLWFHHFDKRYCSS